MLLVLFCICLAYSEAQAQPQTVSGPVWLSRHQAGAGHGAGGDGQKLVWLLPHFMFRNVAGQQTGQPKQNPQTQTNQLVEQTQRLLHNQVNPVIEHEYGKSDIKLLFVRKNTKKHEIYELDVETSLTLDSDDAFRTGDNMDIIATDSQKNTVFILAKMYGVNSPEEFGILLAKHFLDQYSWVVRARITVAMAPWSRIPDKQGREHNHAFVLTPASRRVAEVILERDGKLSVSGGLRDLTVLKTTQSSFVDFVSDEYRTLGDNPDRVLSTTVTADWDYVDLSSRWNIETKSVVGMDFDGVFRTVEQSIFDKFAGPADTGVYSSSVQNTQYLIGKVVLEKVPEIDEIRIDMPNRHYFDVNFSKFAAIPEVQGPGAGEVLRYVSHPSGQISSSLNRENIDSVF